eukprot:13057636-Alexandrium_andersonii.AAC.1
MRNAASGGFGTARNCPEHVRTLSGNFGQSPQLPESARRCPKALENAPSSFRQYRNRLKQHCA